MYSGFITAKRALPAVGVHQRLDVAAYRIATPFFENGRFPARAQVLRFEGVDGPDGLKAKSPGHHEPGHLYNPADDSGDIPGLIQDHYRTLVKALKAGDQVRAAFDAAWLAHYITDGLTPAHHFPLDVLLAAHGVASAKKPGSIRANLVAGGTGVRQAVKNNWALWGGKGLLTTHFNFEMGIAAALIGRRIRVRLKQEELDAARALGPVPYFKSQARSVAEMRMYEDFYRRGWNAEIAGLIVRRLLPQIAQTIAIVWVLAYEEAGLPLIAVAHS